MDLANIPDVLAALDREDRLRTPDDGLLRSELERTFGPLFVDAATNDYLGLGRAEESPPAGAAASRLIFGSHPLHLEVEALVADWVGLDASLLFTSGYAANVGALGALLSPEDAVFSDALNHASLIDGIRLSRARPTLFEHLNLKQLEQQLSAAQGAPARWVVVESYYSMDGDGPELARLRRLCDDHRAHLYVDEAHSIGTFGPRGAGLCAEAGVRPDVLVAAFGKSVGAQGACVCGSQLVRTWLWNRARAFVYSTAMSPVLAETLLRQLKRCASAESERRRLVELSTRVRARLVAAGVDLPIASFGPVLALRVGSSSRALTCAARLREAGVLAQAVRPPTVPEGSSRIRVVLHASFGDSAQERLVDEILTALSE